MVFAILGGIIIIAFAAALTIPKIRDRVAKRGMLERAKTARGHIGMSLPEGEAVGTVSAAGFSVSGNGGITDYYAYEKGTSVKGFILDFACRAPVDGQYSLTLHSLSKDQEDPY